MQKLNRKLLTYIIIVTSKDKKNDLIEAFKAGADDYISKPFIPEELSVRIKNSERILKLEDHHKDLQRVLMRGRNKLRTVLDGLNDEITAIDKDDQIVSLNKAAMKALGGQFDTLIGKNCFELNRKLTAPIWSEQIEQLSRQVFATGSVETTLDQYEDSSGNHKYKQQSILPVKDEDGQVGQIILVSRDVTQDFKKTNEIKKLNEKLKKTTIEINAKNIKLEKALIQLEETQTQILQSEKMASIGQLAAGVAHEINNPIGFVSSNLRTLGEYRTDLEQIINQYRGFIKSIDDTGHELPATLATLLSQIKETEDNIDIDYIQEDIAELIQDCLEGTERIRKIVLDLKDFAHPGEDKPKDTDLNGGLESTLNVVNNELKYKAKVMKKFGDLPLIQCYPHQINQVFMNILVNAAQSIEKSGEIIVETQAVDNGVEIRISDTGCGIAKENLTRIFDPFFTTKEVGKGTGLGMNIAYNIIQKHHGTITVESELDQGTTFTVHLPLTLPFAEEQQ